MSNVDQRPSPQEVAHLFLTPRRPAQVEALVLPGIETHRLATPEGELVVQRAGHGPAVLLVHGWEGQACDLAAMAPPLLAAGFAVTAVHLPAHGDSPGQQSSIPQAARTLRAAAPQLGALHGAIAHSVGSAVLVEALHAGLAVQRVVLIAAPAYYERYARKVAAAAGLDADGTEAMLGLLSGRIGMDVREVSLPARAPLRHEPALFLHSGDDRVVAIEDSLMSAAAWPGARHQRVDGLGHRRILFDPAVVAAAVDFIASTC
ncbi:alpha/beta fold hydrolase [Ideonella sp. BN130291]|uniref:alpha/beta fold hydrolase n=1 Tax=Ideonella sp. BN130291 TaxID=3112940 RepID=UPI002E264B38|nr:alpha/beta hydrolase [Ideonella sp. BN130291]